MRSFSPLRGSPSRNSNATLKPLNTVRFVTFYLGCHQHVIIAFNSIMNQTDGFNQGCSRSWELRTQKLKTNLLRSQSLNVFHLKPGVPPYISIHATLTARDFFLANVYPSGPFTCIFSKTSPEFFQCWLWLTPVPLWVRRIK